MKKVTLSVEIEVPDEYNQDECIYELVHWLDDAKWYHMDAWMAACNARPDEFPNEAWRDATIRAHKTTAARLKQAMQTINILDK